MQSDQPLFVDMNIDIPLDTHESCQVKQHLSNYSVLLQHVESLLCDCLQIS
jgi:hypothetical protein